MEVVWICTKTKNVGLMVNFRNNEKTAVESIDIHCCLLIYNF